MISDRFKQMREALGKTQTEFGVGIGVSRSVIKNIEYGVTQPTKLFLTHLCEVYKVNQIWLENGEGEMFDKANQPDETAKMIESISDSPAMRSLLATWAQLDPVYKEVFEKFAADYVEEYNRSEAERRKAELDALVESETEDAESEKKSV